MSDALQDAGSPYGFIRRGSVFSLVLVPGRKRLYNHAEVAEQDTTLFAILHQALLERGFLIAPTVHEPGFIYLAHSVVEIRALACAVEEVISRATLKQHLLRLGELQDPRGRHLAYRRGDMKKSQSS